MDDAELIVVGLDGSEHSRVALRWAMADAARRGARIEVVRAFDLHRDWPDACGLPPLSRAEVTARLEAVERGVVRSVVAEGGSALAGVPVEVVALAGSPGDVLVRRARGADLLVVGSRGLGSGAAAGSVGLSCALHAPCPVTIVRPVAERSPEVTERTTVPAAPG